MYHSVRAGLHPQRALRIALSMYNTGSQSRGFSYGYVGRVVGNAGVSDGIQPRSEEHTSELQSLMRTPYAAFCLKKMTTEKHKTSVLQQEHSTHINRYIDNCRVTVSN